MPTTERPALKRITALALAAAAIAATLPAAAADVGVSVSISQPGVYGRIDIGRFPQPVVVAPQPVVIGRPVVVAPQPVYMWVPPGHRKNWGKHCSRYNACGVPVYFVDDRWYDQHVMAEHRREHGDDRGKGHDKDKGKGNGKGHGKGHD
jgi:hypothetical protein